MPATILDAKAQTGQITWTRDLARDLFPGPVTPFAWTLLRDPAEAAIQQTWADLGAADLDARSFWHRGEDCRVVLNSTALRRASLALHGAAWLGAIPGQPPAGPIARWRAQGSVRRTEQAVTTAFSNVPASQARLASWLNAMRRLRWSQADLLQVMEELEPAAQEALHAYLTLRAGLAGAAAQVSEWLDQWVPARPPNVVHHLYAALEGLPSVAAAGALAALSGGFAGHADRQAFLAHYGHRGPGELRPDAWRWHDHPEAMDAVAALLPRREGHHAADLRGAAQGWLSTRLDAAQHREFQPVLERARALCRAADIAWDMLTIVMAAAQLWSRALAAEAMAAGLLAEAADVCYLELEELKRIATGEWHGGNRDEVRAEIARRQATMSRLPAVAPPHAVAMVPASPGQARGPAQPMPIGTYAPPEPGAVLVAEAADPGWTAHWLAASAVVVSAPDLWSSGMIVARTLGVPAVAGARQIVEKVRAGQTVVVDGDAGQALLE